MKLRFIPVLLFLCSASALAASALAAPATARLTAPQAKALIEHMASPVSEWWNEISVEVRVLTVVATDKQSKRARIENDFWKDSTYSAIDPAQVVDYARVVKFAYEEGGVSVFREIGQAAKDTYLSKFVSRDRADSQALARLSAGLPDEEAFGVGYTDALSDPFGDELFIFPFEDGDLEAGGNGKYDFLVITIHHVHA
jgi:hypothetical protein